MENITLNEISYGLLEVVRANISDDENISLRQIKDWVHTTRAMMLKQLFGSKPRVIHDYLVQDLGNIELEKVDSSLVDGINTGITLLKSKTKIPPTIDRRGHEGTFVRVGPSDRLNTKYNVVSYNRVPYLGNMRYNKSAVYAFLLDDYMYLYSAGETYWRGIKYLNVRGVFQNPEQVMELTYTSGDNIDFGENPYPINRSLKSQIEGIILKEKFNIAVQAPSDNSNDGASKMENNVKPQR